MKKTQNEKQLDTAELDMEKLKQITGGRGLPDNADFVALIANQLTGQPACW